MESWFESFLNYSIASNIVKLSSPFITLVIMKVVLRKSFKLNASYLIPVVLMMLYSPFLMLGCVCDGTWEVIKSYGLVFILINIILMFAWWGLGYAYSKLFIT